jgi:hypothetical protein
VLPPLAPLPFEPDEPHAVTTASEAMAPAAITQR